ncbi:MAG: ferritin family protein [Desulfamplus sp.]|nr:ferritin family protein [Desulfamplus sp.]
MAYSFSADEIFEMAKQIERNGAAFYKEASQKVEGENEKNFLIKLAQIEERHEMVFEEMQKELADKEKSSQVFEPVEEALLYLKAIADTKIFFKKEMPENDMKKILSSAIETEKDSIVFYLGMKELVKGELGKKRVDTIIHEEMGHIRLLSEKFLDYK